MVTAMVGRGGGLCSTTIFVVEMNNVPIGSHKKELLEHLDRVPTYVQQLQFTVKNPTVGKAATFTKVDSVIHETKNLMSVISKVVTTCFVCATKFDLLMPARVTWRAQHTPVTSLAMRCRTLPR
ncbi:Rho protein signal transduction [Homalodisca vitripennis]|nr:Rho protein signal transduction [Homalodisca vitripennis]